MSDPSIKELKRWRLILGAGAADQLKAFSAKSLDLSREEVTIDSALAAIYDETAPVSSTTTTNRGTLSAGLGRSQPRLSKWLGDVRTHFPSDVVAVIQADAVERRGLRKLLMEPELLERVEPTVALVATLLSLSKQIPERTKETARLLVQRCVSRIRGRLERRVRSAVQGSLLRPHTHALSSSHIDWKKTIQRSLKNYQTEIGKLVPEKIYFFSKGRRVNDWTVIVNLDQSGSMAESLIYGAVMGSIFASLPALKTHVVAFDSEVVDLTDVCGRDPVEMLFGLQLGGGTNINQSVAYCESLIENPTQTFLIIISDLREGGNAGQLVRRVSELVESGVKIVCLLALAESGVPRYDERLTKRLRASGVACFACSPERLPDLIEGVLEGAKPEVLSRQLATRS